MKKRFLVVLLSICMLTGLAGCGTETNVQNRTGEEPMTGQEENRNGSSGSDGSGAGNGNGQAGDTNTATIRVADYTGSHLQGDVSILRGGINTFAYEMYDHLNAGEDLFFSPYSLCTALSLLNVGAGGDTQAELQEMLGIEDRDAWNEAIRIYLARTWSEKTYMLTANSVWLQEDKEWAENIDADFLQPAAHYYNSELYKLDFRNNPEEAVEKMNAWADVNTEGMIPEIMKELPPGMVMALMNAVYFQGKWDEPFMEDDTRERTFYGTDGEKQIDMMHQYGEHYAYVESNGMKGIALPYKDSTIVMKVFIPLEEDGDIESLYNALSTEEKEALLDSLDTAGREEIATLAIPKFTMEKGIEGLNDILKDMGMQSAFLETADLDRIAEDVCVSDVLHKAKIEVDEEGTTAAAVTVIAVMECAAMPPEEPVTFIADRPFVYVLQDAETGIILFMGRVNNLE